MPPGSARKSSIGAARRAGQKSHVPYRGDNPFVGRKTGLSVQPVPRGSDGFEPFEAIDQILDQATNKSSRPRKKKSSVHEDASDDDDDENDQDGEMSMDVDSPIQNTRLPTTPRSARRASRKSEVDFDEVPSPRPSSARRQTPGPSPLRRATGPSRPNAQELLDQDEGDDYGYDYGGGAADYGDEPESPRELSFTEMDTRNDDEESEGEPQQALASSPHRGKRKAVEEEPPTSSPKRGKRAAVEEEPPTSSSPKQGKRKAVDEDEDTEDDIARGMDNVDVGPPESDEPEPVQPKSPPKKPASKAKRNPASKSHQQKENREVLDGSRRSRRVPIAPLEWWRNERVEYGGHDPTGGPLLVPRIRAIIRVPKDPVLPLGAKHRTRHRSTTPAATKKGKGKVKIVEKVIEVQVDHQENPEEGWDDETETQAAVKSYPNGVEVHRRVAFTAKMFSPVPAANNEWFFQKIFGDGDFIAAGQIVIPPKGRKPSKPSKDNTFIFFVIEGAVNLKVCDTSLIIASGGMFMIPRGNTYFIENIAERDAKLFFTQARKMREGEGDDEEAPPAQAQTQTQRAASAAAVGSGSRVNANEVRRGVSMHV